MEGEVRPKGGSGVDWYLGLARDKGSLHSDSWEFVTAAKLAECGMIAANPVGDWWRHQRNRDRSARGAPYSLVIGIETDDGETDLWTPVATEVGVPVGQAEIEF